MDDYWKLAKDITNTKTAGLKQYKLRSYANQYENAMENMFFIMHGIISRRGHTFEVCVIEACAI